MNNMVICHPRASHTDLELLPLMPHTNIEHDVYDSCDMALPSCMVSFNVRIETQVTYPIFSAKGEECIPQTWDMYHEK